ncbi:MAG: site-2 protease family protein [Kiritimatiellia bacterium]
MIQKTYHLGRVFGIPIKLDFSVIILAIFLALSLGDLFLGVLAAIGLLLSITLHELGHSVVAMAFGCKVRDITLMLLGGCATMLSMPRKPWQEFLMALAGPTVSLALGALGLLSAHLIPGLSRFMMEVLYGFGVINLVLGIFNLAPAFPMDGGRMLRSLLQQFFMTKLRATWWASRIGRFLAILFAIWNIYFYLFDKAHFGGYLFMRLLLAYYIYSAAEREYRMVLMEERGTTGNPFADIFKNFHPGAGRRSSEPPTDEGQVIVSPPPYKRGSGDRVDIHKE